MRARAISLACCICTAASSPERAVEDISGRRALSALFQACNPSAGWSLNVAENGGILAGISPPSRHAAAIMKTRAAKMKTGIRLKTNQTKAHKQKKIDALERVALDHILPLLPLAETPSAEDLIVIGQRQTGRDTLANDMLGVEAARCKYGRPRAFASYPCANPGIIRLTCPHLVKEIDKWEKEGAIEFVNDLLQKDTTGHLKSNFLETNRQHAEIRKAATSMGELDLLIKQKRQSCIDQRMQSGIIGISREKVDDIKCVHAQVADHLLRGGNAIGELCLEHLEKRGVDVRGCEGCSQQCDPSVKPEDAGWWYMAAKNYLGKKKRRLKFREIKRKERIERSEIPGWSGPHSD